MKRFFLFILFSTFYFLLSAPALAAEMYFSSDQEAPAQNQVFKVSLMLNTQEEEINALEGKVVFSDNLELVQVREGETLVAFWLDQPRLADGGVVFSGITPGGYRGFLIPYSQEYQPGKIFDLIFKAKGLGSSQVNVSDGRVLLNDGQGTPAQLSVKPLDFMVSAATVEPLEIYEVYQEDKVAPEPFKPVISRDPALFEGQYFLAFTAQDKDSGIDHYQVLESHFKKPWLKNWHKAQSPYLLKDQALKSYIYVKAIDKAGNEQLAVVQPQKPFKWYENLWIYVIIITAMIIYFLSSFLKRERNRK